MPLKQNSSLALLNALQPVHEYLAAMVVHTAELEIKLVPTRDERTVLLIYNLLDEHGIHSTAQWFLLVRHVNPIFTTSGEVVLNYQSNQLSKETNRELVLQYPLTKVKEAAEELGEFMHAWMRQGKPTLSTAHLSYLRVVQ